jgi:glycosyltransferase involved in cell wall biosynthesis
LSQDNTVIAPRIKIYQGIATAKETFDAIPFKLHNQKPKNTFSLQFMPDRIYHNVSKINPDIVNIHWANSAFMQIETPNKLNKPIVWTLHDMWAFTGGCHYSENCNRYTTNCGACPQLDSKTSNDLSYWVWKRKAKAWKNLNLTIISPSHWLAKCALSSSLFQNLRVETIPNGIDTEIYHPIDKSVARSLLNLPKDKKLVLFGALQSTSDKRKGFHLLQSALQYLSLSGWQEKFELVIFGDSQPKNQHEFGFKTYYLGTLSDDLSLALVYSAADVFVLPSIEDNLPNTILEAMACGTTCVAFNIGGMPDMIEHQKNGYLAQPFKIEDLAQGITWVLEGKERNQKLSNLAREKIEREFTLELQSHRYLSLFQSILSG